jgi:hypothetical protein
MPQHEIKAGKLSSVRALPQHKQKTPGYCWPTYFKVLEVLFLGEFPQLFVLLQIDLVRIDRTAREIQHGGLSGLYELVNFFDGARLGNPGMSTYFSPKHANQEIAFSDELVINRALWPHA